MSIGATIFVSLMSALFTGFFVYYFGFLQYLKQRNREEVIDYYIKNGIDKVIESLDTASFSCKLNFAKAMRIIEYLEKFYEIENVEKDIIFKIFSEMQTVVIAPTDALYKVQLITGEEYASISRWVIEALADYSRYNDYLRYELLSEVQYYFQFSEKFKGREKDFVSALKNRVLEINKMASENELLKVHLFNLRIRIDEIGLSAMKDFDEKVLKDEKIKETLQKVKEDYQKTQHA